LLIKRFLLQILQVLHILPVLHVLPVLHLWHTCFIKRYRLVKTLIYKGMVAVREPHLLKSFTQSLLATCIVCQS